MSQRHSSVYIDRIGKRYGRWLVVSRAPNGEKGKVFFNCVCDCGQRLPVRSDLLGDGSSQSCGCLKYDLSVVRNKGNRHNVVHGLYKHPLYKIWGSMKNRCYNPNTNLYPDYGGRGIIVCDHWKESFVNFLKDMGERPNTGRRMSLDRINVNGNYEPTNCRWANYSDQRKNTRKMRVLQAEVDSLRKQLKELRSAAPAALA